MMVLRKSLKSSMCLSLLALAAFGFSSSGNAEQTYYGGYARGQLAPSQYGGAPAVQYGQQQPNQGAAIQFQSQSSPQSGGPVYYGGGASNGQAPQGAPGYAPQGGPNYGSAPAGAMVPSGGVAMVPGYQMPDGSVIVTGAPPAAPPQFAVLVGSYLGNVNADLTAGRVRSMGFNSYSRQRVINGKPFIRVYAGPFVDQDSARNAFQHLEAYLNFSGVIVPYEP